MAVPKGKRTLSSLEFFDNAWKLRKETTELLIRDFGVKDKKITLEMLKDQKELSDDEIVTMRSIFAKHGYVEKLIEHFPEWIIEKERDKIMQILSDMIQNIVFANTIKIVDETTYQDRRYHQYCAIACCENLMQEFRYVLDIFPVQASKFEPFIKMAVREANLLRGWHENDKEVFKKLKKSNFKEDDSVYRHDDEQQTFRRDTSITNQGLDDQFFDIDKEIERNSKEDEDEKLRKQKLQEEMKNLPEENIVKF